MKIKKNFVLRCVDNVNIVVDAAGNKESHSSVITLNDTGAFLWRLLEKGSCADALADALVSEYLTDAATAKADVCQFLETLSNAEITED